VLLLLLLLTFAAGLQTALVRSFARMQRDAGRCGYTQLAGIHGSIRRYDNATSTRGG
jgi:hypothetical protein